MSRDCENAAPRKRLNCHWPKRLSKFESRNVVAVLDRLGLVIHVRKPEPFRQGHLGVGIGCDLKVVVHLGRLICDIDARAGREKRPLP
jgi:hypothetical protein